MNESIIAHSFSCFVDELGEVTGEVGKCLRLGKDFSRDKRHTNLERLEMEVADLLATFEEFMLNVKRDHTWLESFNERMADRIHKKRMTIRMEYLLNIEKGMDTLPPQFFNQTVDFYSRTEWWFEETHLNNNTVDKGNWEEVNGQLEKIGQGLREEAALKSNPYLLPIFNHFNSMLEKNLCPFPHDYQLEDDAE